MFFLMEILRHKFQVVCDALQTQFSLDQSSGEVYVEKITYHGSFWLNLKINMITQNLTSAHGIVLNNV